MCKRYLALQDAAPFQYRKRYKAACNTENVIAAYMAAEKRFNTVNGIRLHAINKRDDKSK